MSGDRKPLILLHGEIKTPPFTDAARKEAGDLLGFVQLGESIGMPLSRPMPSIGARCHELRVRDEDHNWRIIYRIDRNHVLVVDVFAKTTRQTPKNVIDACKARLVTYDRGE
jgi:phage-related protein